MQMYARTSFFLPSIISFYDHEIFNSICCVRCRQKISPAVSLHAQSARMEEWFAWKMDSISHTGSPFPSDGAQSEPRNYLKSPVSSLLSLISSLLTHIKVFAPSTITAACCSIRLCANESSPPTRDAAKNLFRAPARFHLLIFTRPKQTGCTRALYICSAATINALVELLRQSFYFVYDLPTPSSFRYTILSVHMLTCFSKSFAVFDL
jgi:hypothetical protein